MASNYLPRTDALKTPWLANLASKLPTYASKYAIADTEITEVTAGAADWQYRMNTLAKVAGYATSWTGYKNQLRDGEAPGVPSVQPLPPVLGTAPTAVAPGLFKRIAVLVQRIKNNPLYTEADGADLGIVGTDAPVTPPDELKPETSLKAGAGGKPQIVWQKGAAEGVAIYKDAGDGFKFYDFDNHPNYDDKAPLPPAATTWRYKLIYRMDGEEVGQFSDPITAHVGQ